MNREPIASRKPLGAPRPAFLVALTLAVALLSSFITVVHEATQRGEAMRREQRLSGRFALPAKPTGTVLAQSRL